MWISDVFGEGVGIFNVARGARQIELVDKKSRENLEFTGFLCYYYTMDDAGRIDEIKSENIKLRLRVSELTATVASQRELIKYYLEQFRLAQHRRFGASSELVNSDDVRQLTLSGILNEVEAEADITLPEPEVEEVTYLRKKRVGKRAEDISGLPVERIEYELPEDQRVCPKCDKPFDDIGVTVRNEIEIIPAQVILKQHVTHAYKPSCDCGQAETLAVEDRLGDGTETNGFEITVVTEADPNTVVSTVNVSVKYRGT